MPGVPARSSLRAVVPREVVPRTLPLALALALALPLALPLALALALRCPWPLPAQEVCFCLCVQLLPLVLQLRRRRLPRALLPFTFFALPLPRRRLLPPARLVRVGV